LAFVLQLILSIDVSISRVCASAGWFSLLIGFVLVPTRISCFSIKSFALGLRASFIIFVIGYFVYPSSGSQFGTFSETSFASLFLSAFLLSELIPFLLAKTKDYSSLFFAVLSIIFILINPASHLFSLMISGLTVYLFSYNLRFFNQLLLFSFSVKTILSGLVLALSLFPDVFQNSYQAVNLSSLAWQGGASQLFQSIFDCPVIGCGAGSTGLFAKLSIPELIYTYFPQAFIPSFYESTLLTLNSLDAYSLFFRSIVEYGLIALPFWFLLGRRILKSMRMCFVSPSHSLKSSLSVLIFSFTCLIGSLLKEPHLFSSITFAPIMISAIVSFKVLNTLSYSWRTVPNKG
jgi:hypothetical protein